MNIKNVQIGASKRPRNFNERIPPSDALDSLLRERYHGAVNIRGIRFQIRYSLLRVFELMTYSCLGDAVEEITVHFEGLEDVDVDRWPALRGLTASNAIWRECVQVKTSSKPWGLHKLGGSIVGFVEILRTGVDDANFRLVFNFPLHGDLERLARFDELKPYAQNAIRTKFRQVCRKVGATDTEADLLLDKLVIQQMSEDELRTRVRVDLCRLAKVSDSAALDAYELMFGGRALQWAAERSRITQRDVGELFVKLRDGLARSEHFNAVSNRLVGPLAFKPDSNPDDFFTGKHARIGHIISGLDVRRSEWLRRIGEAFTTVPLVVIRAPSGNGKSALAYRYAYEEWPTNEIVVTRSIQSEEEVGAIEDYLRFRAELQLPIRVLIDADHRTRLWPRVASVVAALGGKTLVSVRVEDWSRYALDALTLCEIVEPALDLNEAEHIYAVFRDRDRIHPSVDSAAWAFERLRPPYLLLEFVYLITHGEMLGDRLRDQVREFSRIHEDPRKIEVLRIVALANALGAQVPVDALLRAVRLRDDPQEVIGSLLGEYLTLDEGMLGPVHWVRSEHLAKILHTGIPSVTSTALTAASLSPDYSLSYLIANAFNWAGIDPKAFHTGLVECFQSASTTTILAIASGLFEAGERTFFEANRKLFDKANSVIGHGSCIFLVLEVAPVLRVNTITKMLDILGDKAGDFTFLRNIVKEIVAVPRGLDFVGRFLREVGANLSSAALSLDPGAKLGTLLDWCALTGTHLPAWPEARGHVIEASLYPERTIEDVATLAQGLFRFDREAFNAWFARHKDDILAMLQLATRSLSLKLVQPSSQLAYVTGVTVAKGVDEDQGDTMGSAQMRIEEIQKAREDAERFGPPVADVAIVFSVDMGDCNSDFHEQTMTRIELLRRTLPFVGKYSTQGDYLLPEELEPPVDDTIKSISRWHIPLPSDVEKNVVWRTVATKPYLPDTTYRLQEAWYCFRSLALRVARAHVLVLRRVFRNQEPKVYEAFGKDFELYRDFETASKHLPRFSKEETRWIDSSLAVALGPFLKGKLPNDWVTNVDNFSRQIWQYLLKRDEDTGRLMLHNLSEARISLAKMQTFFNELFNEMPDYFKACELDKQENVVFEELGFLVEGLIDPLGWHPSNPVKELRRRHEQRKSNNLVRVHEAVRAAEVETGLVLVPPTGIAHEEGLTSVPIGLECTNLADPLAELIAVLSTLACIADIVNRVWLIPLRGNIRLGDNGYGISTRILKGDGSEWFEDKISRLQLLLPVPVPLEVLACFPFQEVIPYPEPSFAQKFLGLRALVEPYTRRRRAISMLKAVQSHPCLDALSQLERARLANFEQSMVQLTDVLEVEMIKTKGDPSGKDKLIIEDVDDINKLICEVRALIQANSGVFHVSKLSEIL